MCVFFTLTDRASTIPGNTRGCQSSTWSSGQENIRGASSNLQRESMGTKTEQKRQKERNNKHEAHARKIIEEEFGILPAASHPILSPYRSYLAFAPKGITSSTTVTPYSQGFIFLYRRCRRRLGSPWVGPTNATLKRLKLATVIPGATSTLSASSASLFLYR